MFKERQLRQEVDEFIPKFLEKFLENKDKSAPEAEVKLVLQALDELPPNISRTNLIKMMKPFPTIYAKLEKLEREHEKTMQGVVRQLVEGPPAATPVSSKAAKATLSLEEDAQQLKTEEKQTPPPAATPVSKKAAKPTLSPEKREQQLKSVGGSSKNNVTQIQQEKDRQNEVHQNQREVLQQMEDERALLRLAAPLTETPKPMSKIAVWLAERKLANLLNECDHFVNKELGVERGNSSPEAFSRKARGPLEKEFDRLNPGFIKKAKELNEILRQDETARGIFPLRPSLNLGTE